MTNNDFLIKGNMYQYNLGWLIEELLSFKNDLATAIDLKTIKYADPIQWNITTQYPANTVVIDPNTGIAYMSKTAVPQGIVLSNTDYWTVIFDYAAIYNDIMRGVAFNEENNEHASKDMLVNDLVWFGGKLYRVTKPITAGGQYLPDNNIVLTSIESLLSTYYGRDRVAQVLNDTLNVSGDYTINAGDIAETSTNRTEKVTSDKTVDIDGNYTSIVEGNYNSTANGMQSITAKSLKVHSDTPLQFGTPAKFNDWLNSIKLVAENGEEYDVLANGERLANTPLSFVTPEEFGAIGDGVTDDSSAIMAAFNEAKTNNRILLLGQSYRIDNDLDFDGYNDAGNYTTFNIMCTGKIIPYAHIFVRRCSLSRVEITLDGGSDTLTDAACTIGPIVRCDVTLVASEVKTTAFQIGGGKKAVNWCTFRVNGNNNYRTLIHGDEDGTQSAFGNYDYIIDSTKYNCCIIKNSYDICIKHFEGYYRDDTHTKNAFEIINGGSIHFGDFAQGGQAQCFLYCSNTAVDIAYCFLNGESYGAPYPNGGIRVDRGYLTIGTMKANYVTSGVRVDTGADATCYIAIGKAILIPIQNVVALDLNGKTASFYIGNTPTNGTITAGSGVSSDLQIASTGRKVSIDGSFTTTAEIPAYRTIFTVPWTPLRTTNAIACDSAGIVYPIYANAGSATFSTRKVIPANTELFLKVIYDKRATLM